MRAIGTWLLLLCAASTLPGCLVDPPVHPEVVSDDPAMAKNASGTVHLVYLSTRPTPDGAYAGEVGIPRIWYTKTTGFDLANHVVTWSTPVQVSPEVPISGLPAALPPCGANPPETDLDRRKRIQDVYPDVFVAADGAIHVTWQRTHYSRDAQCQGTVAYSQLFYTSMVNGSWQSNVTALTSGYARVAFPGVTPRHCRAGIVDQFASIVDVDAAGTVHVYFGSYGRTWAGGLSRLYELRWNPICETDPQHTSCAFDVPDAPCDPQQPGCYPDPAPAPCTGVLSAPDIPALNQTLPMDYAAEATLLQTNMIENASFPKVVQLGPDWWGVAFVRWHYNPAPPLAPPGHPYFHGSSDVYTAQASTPYAWTAPVRATADAADAETDATPTFVIDQAGVPFLLWATTLFEPAPPATRRSELAAMLVTDIGNAPYQPLNATQTPNNDEFAGEEVGVVVNGQPARLRVWATIFSTAPGKPQVAYQLQ